MSVTEISVKRPTAVWMAVVLILALGVFGYKSMGSSLLPDMNIPILSIVTTYNGASAEDIKKDIVKPIEDSVSGINGVDTISSTSQEGTGSVMIKFKSSANINTAYLDVQKAIDNASRSLPKDANKPTIFKMDTNAIPILVVSLNGSANSDELYNEGDSLKQKLEKIPGVGQVSIMGAQKKELVIRIDKTAMEYYGVSTNTISSKIQAANTSVPAGQIKQDNMNQSVRVIGQFNNIDSVKNMLIPTTAGGTVRLGDIAKVSLEAPEDTSIMRYKGKKTLAVVISKQSDANVVEVANTVKKELQSMKKDIPSGINMDIAMDTTTFITSSLVQIKHNLIEGIITTAIVLYLFFRSLRSSLVVLVAIPTSLIATFFMMYELHFSMNMLSMMGLSLVVGTLVDDSIVVIENIQRHFDLGKPPIEAAIGGRKEVGLAAIAISFCDMVVFAPISLMSGTIGQMFKEFGLTIVVATIFSLIVSFTVTPMLSARLLKKREESVKEKSGFFTKSIEIYRGLIIKSLHHRGKVIIAFVIGLIFSVALIPMGLVKLENMPKYDQSEFTIDVKLSAGATLKQTDEKVAQVENYLNGLKEVKSYYSSIGASGRNSQAASGQITVNLVPKDKRKKSQSELVSQVRDFGNKNLTGVDFNVSEAESGSSGASKPISIEIKGNNSDTLKELSKEVEDIIKKVPGVTDVGSSAEQTDNEIKVNIDNLAASQYGLSTSEIGSTIRVALAGSSAGTYRANDDENDINIKFMDGQIKSVEDIKNMKIANQSGQQIAVSQVATVEKTDTKQSISREDKQDIVTVNANIVQGKSLGEVSKAINSKIKATTIPSGYTVSFGGDQKSMDDSFSSLGKALAASVALVYMILVVLYQSYLTPAIRMLSLPSAIMGALIALALTGQSINTMSFIGIIMLEGLSSKNGTLLIDYTNTLMDRGMSLRDALVESAITRLRPIVMTTSTIIVSMLPVALSLGEGAELKKSMGIVIIGGMLMSTILTLFVIPVVYTLMEDFKNSILRKRKSKNIGGRGQYEV